MRPLQLLPHRFDLELATEKILRFRFGERSETRVGPLLLAAWKLQMDFFEGSRKRACRVIARVGLPGESLL
jgi:hypothetical protein